LATDATRRYEVHTEMQYMKGSFVGNDGIARQRPFLFVCLDNLLTQGASPLGPHSYDAGVSPTGVTWVTEVPEGSANADLDDGTASLHAENICVFDAFTLANSLTFSRPLGNIVKGVVDSLSLEWH